MQCEMCGANIERSLNAKIEGVVLKVCNNCSKYGEIEKKKRPEFRPSSKKGNAFQKPVSKLSRNNSLNKEQESVERVVFGAGKIIKDMRESKNMRQVDLAKRLQVKDSLLHHIETGDMKLNIDLAKKIEGVFGITLVKTFKIEKKVDFESNDSSSMTIGDLIKIKTRK